MRAMIGWTARMCGVGLAAAVLTGTISASHAQGQDAVAAFFKGRTIQAVVGFQGGSTYDLVLRAFARHVSKHLPGNPTVIVQNMPGAGALTATLYIANVAARDGSVIGIHNPTNLIEPLINPQAKFDPAALGWVGSVADEHTSCGFWAKDINTLADLRKREIAIGATGGSAGSAVEGRLVSAMLDLKFRIVEGYRGLAEVRLAAERGELDGHCALFRSVLTSEQREAYKAGRIKIPIQIGLTSHPDFTGIPNLFDLVDEQNKAVLRLTIGQWRFARPISLPPSVAADRLAAWRAAFDATMIDPQFEKDMEKAGLPVRPLAGAQIQPMVAEMMGTPQNVIDRARSFIKGQ
jgi:tripartite-type tricarboxylate transporter receptor subunit TctC